MAYSTGFDTAVTINSNAVKTVGDVSFGDSYTEIPIKTKGNRLTRYIKGMHDTPISLTVYAGTDPDDSNAFDAFNFLLGKVGSDSDFPATIGGVSGTFICTGYTENDPVDDLRNGTFELKPSGYSAQTSGGSGT